MELQPGEIVLHQEYQIQKLLGKGGFGRVYLARHTKTQAYAAIKILHAEDAVGSATYNDAQNRFIKEAQIGSLIRHPGIIHVDQFAEENRTLFLVMEYAEGGSLEQRIKLPSSQGWQPLRWQLVVSILAGTSAGLAVLHERDIVHRDIKPANILLDKEGRVKISDLGLAQVPHDEGRLTMISSAQAAHHPGTPGFMSPEQDFSFNLLSSASDIYALGVTAFLMLTGRMAGTGSVRPGTPPSRLVPQARIPAWLDALVLAMLSRDPEQRPYSGRELLDCLKEQRSPAPAGTAAPVETAEQRSQREREAQLRAAQDEKRRKEDEERAWQERENRMRQELEAKIRREQAEKEKRAAEELARQEAEQRKNEKRAQINGNQMILNLGPGVDMKLMRVPAGTAIIGGVNDRKSVHIPEFWMGRFPVTNAQYGIFCRAAGYAHPNIPANMDDYPVVYVTLDDARAFVQWLNQAVTGLPGGMMVRLPTELEWEKAARGTDGRTYPWGNAAPDRTLCNFDNTGLTQPGQFSPQGDSPCGCADMAGNVWEWTNVPVLRGGSFRLSALFLPCANRDIYTPGLIYSSIGFRVCAGPILS